MIRGECFCGGVAYAIDGALTGAQACHCSRCRRAFSGAGSTFARIPRGSFTFTRGEAQVTRYDGEDGGGMFFCSVCGSTLAGLWQGEVVGVTLGSVSGDPGVRIERHIFVGSKAPWDEIGGDAPQYPEFPPEA